MPTEVNPPAAPPAVQYGHLTDKDFLMNNEDVIVSGESQLPNLNWDADLFPLPTVETQSI